MVLDMLLLSHTEFYDLCTQNSSYSIMSSGTNYLYDPESLNYLPHMKNYCINSPTVIYKHIWWYYHFLLYHILDLVEIVTRKTTIGCFIWDRILKRVKICLPLNINKIVKIKWYFMLVQGLWMETYRNVTVFHYIMNRQRDKHRFNYLKIPNLIKLFYLVIKAYFIILWIILAST